MCELRQVAIPDELRALVAGKDHNRLRVSVQFNLGRAFYQVITPTGTPPAPRALSGDVGPNFVEITGVFGPGPLSGPTTLEVMELGEPIEYVRFIVVIDDTVVTLFERVIGETGDCCNFAKAEYVSRQPAKDEAVFFGVSDYARALRTGPGTTSEDADRSASRDFFMGLDLQTHPALRAGEPELISACSHAVAILEARVMARASGGAWRRPKRLVEEYERPITALFEALLKQHLGDSTERLDRAFELFAGGELRWQLPHKEWMTQPSSGWLFLFGEFALAAHENRSDARWLEIARPMIRSQEIFMVAYRRHAGEKGMGAYSGCDYAGPAPQTFVQYLRKRYEGFEYDDLLCQSGLNALAAFPDCRE